MSGSTAVLAGTFDPAPRKILPVFAEKRQTRTMPPGLAGLLLPACLTRSRRWREPEQVEELRTREIKSPVDELNALRAQRRWWRIGSVICVMGILIACLLILRSSAASLLETGPAHDEFVAELNREFTKQVSPRTSAPVARTTSEKVPSLEAGFPIKMECAIPDCEAAQPVGRASGDDPGAKAASAEVGGKRAKALAYFRQQTVSEYQDTVKKIINDLSAIRQTQAGQTSGGLPANTVAILLVSRVQDVMQKQALENHAAASGQSPLEDTE